MNCFSKRTKHQYAFTTFLPILSSHSFKPLICSTKTISIIQLTQPSTMITTDNDKQSPTVIDNQNQIFETLTSIRKSPIVLCIRMNDPYLAISAASAAINGGLTTVEVAMTTPNASMVIRQLVETHKNATIGAGTVLTYADVVAARDAGASFAFSPVTDASIIRACHEMGILAVPGAATPTECFNAYHHAGAKLVKVFPINLYGGIDFVKAMNGPFPQIPLVPSSGITFDSLPTYLAQNNVLAIGASRQILLKEALASKDWASITEIAKKWADLGKLYVHKADSGT